MAHLTSPNSLRLGKTKLWIGTTLLGLESDVMANNAQGLGVLSAQILRRRKCLVVSYSISQKNILGTPCIKILYYPLVNPLSRKRLFPLYSLLRLLNSFSGRFSPAFRNFLFKAWLLRIREFNDRFISARKNIQLNKWLSALIFSGVSSALFTSRRLILNKMLNLLPLYRLKARLKFAWQRQRPRRYFSNNLLTYQVRRYSGIRVQITAINVFSYLSTKFGQLKRKTHQNHIRHSYHRAKRSFTSYYNVVNAFYLLAVLPSNTGQFVIEVLQYSLFFMHPRKIKPKRFFYMVDSIIKQLPELGSNYHTCRVLISGKLRGGTSRTGAMVVGFGVVPRQSLSLNVQFYFGNLHSKYGSFGIKLVTWRKTPQ